ncbi:MAG: restriction endonuclease subunit S [Flavobacteriales bacterium]|nr:restriction endonuclease subunit S [Flavobacteriales bacterium]
MELKELGTVCDLQNGYAFKSGDYIDSSDTVSLRMSNIRPGGNFDNSYNLRFLPNSFQNTYSKYIIKDGDLVIAMTDLANDPKILGVPTIVETGKLNWLLNQRAGKLLILDNSKADKNYLRYILNHPIHRNYYKKFAGGGLQINVGKKEILGCKIPLPPLKTQQKIASILDDAAALRDKTAQLLKEYDLLAQSIFLEMFGDPFNNQNNFDQGTIRDLVEEAKYGTSSKAGDEGEFAYLRMNNLTYSGYMDYAKLKYVDVAEKDFEKYVVRKGDILFNRTNSRELVGKTAIFDSATEMIAAGYLIRIRLNELGNPYFVWGYLNSKHGKLILNNMCKNIVGMANINAQELQNIKILVPPIELQNQFAETIALIEQQKALAKQELQESEDLFNCLLQKAFKGELV